MIILSVFVFSVTFSTDSFVLFNNMETEFNPCSGFHNYFFPHIVKEKRRFIMYNSQCNCNDQKHVHELTGSVKIFRECDDCHNHRFCTVSGEAIYTKDKNDHFHEVKFHTDFSDKHFHEFCGKTGGAINVGMDWVLSLRDLPLLFLPHQWHHVPFELLQQGYLPRSKYPYPGHKPKRMHFTIFGINNKDWVYLFHLITLLKSQSPFFTIILASLVVSPEYGKEN